jgi:hydroxymethylbilane synthase
MNADAMIFATRPSALARWQTTYIIQQLQSVWPGLACEQQVITTQGDRILDVSLPEIGGKGLFTSELEGALSGYRVHAAVHSLKDLPTEDSPGLTLGAVPARADPRDVLVSPGGKDLGELPAGSVIGTSSNRRKAQLLAYRPDLKVEAIRGNIDTRIRKAMEGQYDAIVLAAAGVTRLGLDEHITEYLPVELMLPAPGQGALAVQCRVDDTQSLERLLAIENAETRLAVRAERAFLSALGGGCSLPVGALATVHGSGITLQGVVASLDGRQVMRLEVSGSDPLQLGRSLAAQALDQGARDYLYAGATGGNPA